MLQSLSLQIKLGSLINEFKLMGLHCWKKTSFNNIINITSNITLHCQNQSLLSFFNVRVYVQGLKSFCFA